MKTLASHPLQVTIFNGLSLALIQFNISITRSSDKSRRRSARHSAALRIASLFVTLYGRAVKAETIGELCARTG
jgi:hypothetical protein